MSRAAGRGGPLLNRRDLLRAAAVATGTAIMGPTLARAVPPPSPLPVPTWLTGPIASADPGSISALPVCRYGDEPAVGDPDTDWATMVLDTIHRLGPDDRPRRLVSVRKAGIASELGARIIPAVVDDLRALHDASVEAGAEVAIRTAYRSYAQQATVFSHWVAVSSERHARTISARPGHSEHQLGSALDFSGAGDPLAPWDHADWGRTAPGAWMGEHAWRFGFVLSYPKGMTDRTCYAYEPWHYRYVGRHLAQAIQGSGLTPREYLWATFGGRTGA